MSNTESQFGLLGTAIDHGQEKPGVDKAYEHLKQMGFWKELAEKFSFRNFGDMEKTDSGKAYNNLFHKTLEIINSGFKPLLLGGDHSQAFASISAICTKYPGLRILWIDAHADMNTPETSPSGNTHGMPVAGLLGLINKNKWAMPWLNQLVKPTQFVQLGVRDIDNGEQRLVKEHKIEHHSPEELRKQGLENVLNKLAQRWKGQPVHLSFDIDALDASLVPATATPVEGGFNMDEAEIIIQSGHRQFDLVSSEVVEFNPELGKNPKELFTTEKNVKKLMELILDQSQ